MNYLSIGIHDLERSNYSVSWVLNKGCEDYDCKLHQKSQKLLTRFERFEVGDMYLNN